MAGRKGYFGYERGEGEGHKVYEAWFVSLGHAERKRRRDLRVHKYG